MRTSWRLALRLAARGLGRTWPNPAVGCVVVKDGRIVGRGWTQPGGRPHAETEALGRAGRQALGATAYVTFEPCAHYGRTPPCTMALIHAGVRRVVVATTDPDRRVDGQGVAQLRQAGVEVELGLLRAEAEALNAGFLLKERARRPLVTLKLATSLDGRIATRSGQSQWLTGQQARARGHWLRATHDAIMVGSGTALADDPALTCRLPGLDARSPVRVVLDGRLRLPPISRLAMTACAAPTWLFTHQAARAEELRRLGVEVIEVGGRAGAGTRAGRGAGGARGARHHAGAGRRWRTARGRAAAPAPGRPARLVPGAADRRRRRAAGRRRARHRGPGRGNPRRARGQARAGAGHAAGLYPVRRGGNMFTGIITDVGRVVAVAPDAGGDGRRMTIETRLPLAEIPPGGSIATSGICFTAVDKGTDWFSVDASGATLEVTTAGSWREGDAVNLERSLRIGDELGGHIVFGHVDAVGRVEDLSPAGDSHRLQIAVPRSLAPLIAVKGSIAVDGISLTVNEVTDAGFVCNIIPHSWRHTNLAERAQGDPVNLEVDMLARYVARQLAFREQP